MHPLRRLLDTCPEDRTDVCDCPHFVEKPDRLKHKILDGKVMQTVQNVNLQVGTCRVAAQDAFDIPINEDPKTPVIALDYGCPYSQMTKLTN